MTASRAIPFSTRTLVSFLLACLAVGGIVIVSLIFAPPASAVPSFAEQTGQPCQSCHVGGFGPQLTPLGREFKLGGYTMRSKSFNMPLSAMAVASFTHTKKDQSAPPADGYKVNDNIALDQASVFLAGGVGSHFGGFVQTTYDGIAKAWSWDNLDLRAVGKGEIGGTNLVYGVSLNNSPSVQDVWNTLPAWGYPYTSSGLAPGPAAAPLIDGALAQEVLGLTGYAWIGSKFYLEGGAYSSPSAGTLHWLGADPLSPGKIAGLAPYGRVAFQHALAGGTAELGAFALKAAIQPGRDRSTGHTDHYSDLGLDASWIRTMASGDVFTFNGRYTHERYSLAATCVLGMRDGSIAMTALQDCAGGHLSEARADASYYWRNKIGGTVGAFVIQGSANPSLYTGNRTAKPNSSGFMLQLDGTPFGGSDAPLGPRFNIRMGVQYTAYTKFDGARRNFDGAGTSASDNNTLRVFTWLAF
jgi:hypothetical protein